MMPTSDRAWVEVKGDDIWHDDITVWDVTVWPAAVPAIGMATGKG